MLTLTIRHNTTYRYRQPVAFGEHRMMLRPRDFHGQRVLEARLKITPEPMSLRLIQDGFGNHVEIAQFSGRARELSFDSLVCVEHAAPAVNADDATLYPFRYGAMERATLAGCLARDPVSPDDPVALWAAGIVAGLDLPVGVLALLAGLSTRIHRDFAYRRREARGIQSPVETLRLGHGSCRDFAVLMMAAARALGFAARFASGYLAAPLDDSQGAKEAVQRVGAAAGDAPEHAAGHGATHAWAQVYLPASGWIDFDPTAGSVGRQGLVTVAVVEVPDDATPLHGTFLGFPSDHIGMDVAVSITAGRPPAAAAAV
jgi:transglutaminase-like putative cysteine protease